MVHVPNIVVYEAEMEMWLEQLTSAVRRSLCEGHFGAFMDFHDGVVDLSHALTCAIPRIKAQATVFFPPPPVKISKVSWVMFDSWCKYGHGDGVEDECYTWGNYGNQCVKNCSECKATSINHPRA